MILLRLRDVLLLPADLILLFMCPSLVAVGFGLGQQLVGKVRWAGHSGEDEDEDEGENGWQERERPPSESQRAGLAGGDRSATSANRHARGLFGHRPRGERPLLYMKGHKFWWGGQEMDWKG